MRKKFFDKSLFSLKDDLGELNLFKLAIPHFLDLFFVSLLGLVSMVVTNYISNNSALGVSTANTLINMVLNVANLANVGATILMSIYMGKGDVETVKKISFINIILTIIINTILCVVLIIFAEYFLALMQLNSAQMSDAITYLRIRLAFLILNALTTCIVSMLRCYGDNKPTLVCGLVTNVVSTALSLITISPINFFSNQILGVSYAPVIGSALGLIIGVVFWLKSGAKLKINFEGKLIKRLFVVGTPGGMSRLSYCLSQVITTAFIMTLPSHYPLAKNNISSVLFIIYQFGFALGNASAIMVGRCCGAGKYETADKMHRQNMVITVLCNIALYVVMFALKDVIFLIFKFDTPELKEQTIKIMNTVLYIDIFVEIGRALNHVGEYGLNGVGDVYATTIISVSSCWLISVLLAYVFGIVLDLKLVGIWIAFAIDECLRGTLYFFRWRSGKWKKKFLDNKI